MNQNVQKQKTTERSDTITERESLQFELGQKIIRATKDSSDQTTNLPTLSALETKLIKVLIAQKCRNKFLNSKIKYIKGLL